jgi:hypothetical protein
MRKSLRNINTSCFFLFLFSLSQLSIATLPPQEFTPERIILNLTEKPATSQAVTWRTGSKIANPQAQIAIAQDSPDLHEKAEIIPAKTEAIQLNDEKTVYHHSVVFTSLKPKTLYAYRVGDGKTWSEWSHFKTASQASEPFKFVYFGDPQNKIKSLCSRTFRAAYQKAPEASFWLFTGDIVDNGDDDEQWEEFFYALGWIPRITPMMLLPGNHGYRKRTVDGKKIRKINRLWSPQFTLPENGPEGLAETAYYIDYHGVKLVMLNGNEKLEEQAKWLDNILSDNLQQWTIAAIHQPFFSTGKERDNPHLRKLFLPIFDRHSVDLVLQGHDHTYGRSHKLLNSSKVKDDQKGTVYVVSVSGPKIYSINPRYEELMVKMGTGRQLFQVITVEQNQLNFESWTVVGELFDSFELTK